MAHINWTYIYIYILIQPTITKGHEIVSKGRKGYQIVKPQSANCLYRVDKKFTKINLYIYIYICFKIVGYISKIYFCD